MGINASSPVKSSRSSEISASSAKAKLFYKGNEGKILFAIAIILGAGMGFGYGFGLTEGLTAGALTAIALLGIYLCRSQSVLKKPKSPFIIYPLPAPAVTSSKIFEGTSDVVIHFKGFSPMTLARIENDTPLKPLIARWLIKHGDSNLENIERLDFLVDGNPFNPNQKVGDLASSEEGTRYFTLSSKKPLQLPLSAPATSSSSVAAASSSSSVVRVCDVDIYFEGILMQTKKDISDTTSVESIINQWLTNPGSSEPVESSITQWLSDLASSGNIHDFFVNGKPFDPNQKVSDLAQTASHGLKMIKISRKPAAPPTSSSLSSAVSSSGPAAASSSSATTSEVSALKLKRSHIDTQGGLIYGPEAWAIWDIEVLDQEIPERPKVDLSKGDKVLLYIPQSIKVNGKKRDLTLNVLKEIRGPLLKISKKIEEAWGEDKNSSIHEWGWLLIDKNVIHESRGKTYETHIEMLSLKSCSLLSLLETVIVTLMVFDFTDERLYGDKTYTRCREYFTISDYKHPLVVGNFTPEEGLTITYMGGAGGNISIGVAGARHCALIL